MKKTDENLTLLTMIFCVTLIVSNVVTAKLFATGLWLFGTQIVLPGAVICYAITYLMTDVIGEIWGRDEANRTVRIGMIAQIIATAVIVLSRYLPTPDASMLDAYVLLLGQNVVFVIGSLAAYLTSQSWDVWVFHKVRDRHLAKGGSVRNRWIWNNASTMSSQIIDTVIFIAISFGLGFGWFFDPAMWPTLGAMLVGQYIVKFLLAALDTPFFYLMTRERNRAA